MGQSVQQRCLYATMLAHDENNDNGYETAIELLSEGIALNPCAELFVRRGLLMLESFKGEDKDKGIAPISLKNKNIY